MQTILKANRPSIVCLRLVAGPSRDQQGIGAPMTPGSMTVQPPPELRVLRENDDGLAGEALDGQRSNGSRLAERIHRSSRTPVLHNGAISARREFNGRHSFQNVLSNNSCMLEVFDQIAQVADLLSTVLVVGETGTGKEEVARAIHLSSNRKERPFVAVNCGALNENLLESELFGHEKGSFTGAAGKRKGRFEVADGGTLLLDEIGDMPMAMQVRLLRVLQERRFERVGGSESIAVDVRVIAATHRDLQNLIKQGSFRDDLYYRLNVIRIDLPPLRDRPEDIQLLAAHFCQKFARPGHLLAEISPEAIEVLLRCPWPGNVRQLENAIERACAMAHDGVIRPKNLPPELTRKSDVEHPVHIDLTRSLMDQLAEMTASFEKRYIYRALRKTHGHIGKCARLCGVSRRTIQNKIVHYGIDRAELKKEEERRSMVRAKS
jgi:transcriptional regulator with PAS, ATPase and Fis domain